MSADDLKERVKRRMEDGLVGTVALSTWLTSTMLSATDGEKARLWELIDNAMAYYKSILATVPKGPGRVAIMHALIDAQGVPEQSTCKRTCHFCCAMDVSAIPDELVRMGEIPAKGKSGYCAYLSEVGECSVYDRRPAMCRLHHVASNPVFCSVASNAEATARIMQLLPELILAAFIELNECSDVVQLPRRP